MVGISTRFDKTRMFCSGLKLLAALAELVVYVWILNASRNPEALLPSHYHFHRQISDLKCYFRFVRSWAWWCLSNRLWFAPCALKHNGTFARPVSFWSFFFSMWEQTDKKRASEPVRVFVQFKFLLSPCVHAGATEDSSVFVLQGTLSPSGQERVLTSLDLFIITMSDHLLVLTDTLFIV